MEDSVYHHIQVACPQTNPSGLVMVGMVTGHKHARLVTFKMPRSLSTDLRWRIVWLYFHKGFTMNKVADTMVISYKTVQRAIKLYRANGDVEPVS